MLRSRPGGGAVLALITLIGPPVLPVPTRKDNRLAWLAFVVLVLILDLVHGRDRQRRVCVSAASTYLGSHPDRLHDLLGCCSLAHG